LSKKKKRKKSFFLIENMGLLSSKIFAKDMICSRKEEKGNSCFFYSCRFNDADGYFQKCEWLVIKFLQTDDIPKNILRSEKFGFSCTNAIQERVYEDIPFIDGGVSSGEHWIPVNIVRPDSVPMDRLNLVQFEISFTSEYKVEAIFQCEFL
jgi:hypothetical protein